MNWFTADYHFGDPRIATMLRDYVARDWQDCMKLIVNNYLRYIKPEDTVYFVGDTIYDKIDEETKKICLHALSKLPGKKILIYGNNDKGITKEEYLTAVDEVCTSVSLTIYGRDTLVQHIPIYAATDSFNIVGHIHGDWRIQRNMINVGIDAWHFCPVSEERIIDRMIALKNYHDQNSFAGELEQNTKYKRLK